MHLPASYTTWRHITMYRRAFHTFLSGAQKPSPQLPQYLYNTDFQKILWWRHSISVHMPYLSYKLHHYQHTTNGHANATKATKYIQHYKQKNNP